MKTEAAAGYAADLTLVARILDGDKTAERSFVVDHMGWMRALANRILGDMALADDAVQDAFANAFRALARYEGRSTLKTWLHRITTNAALMKLRKIKRLGECPLDESAPEYDIYGFRLEEPGGHFATPEQALENQELRLGVIEEIAKLPENYRNVLQLRDIEEMDTAEVAQSLGISESNVKVRLHRARAALKKLLEPRFRGELT